MSHMGIPVLSISCITNMAAGILPQKLTYTEVMETTQRVKETFTLLVLGATVVFTSIVSGLTYVLRWGSRAWRVAHGAP